jgi:hypothetical protein
MTSLILNRRGSRSAGLMQRWLSYAALVAAFAMVIGVSLGLGRAVPVSGVVSAQIDGR